MHRFAQGATAPAALRVVDCPSGADFKEKGRGWRRGLCRRVASLRSGGDSAYGAEGCGLPSRAMSFISRLRRSRQHRVSIFSAYLVHPFPLRGTSPQGETRALRDLLFCIIWHDKHSADWLAALAPPIRLRRTSPRESVSHDSQVALLPYESCSLATPVQGEE